MGNFSPHSSFEKKFQSIFGIFYSILSNAYDLLAGDSLLKTFFPSKVSECFDLRYRSGQSITDRIKSQFNFMPIDNESNNNNDPNTGMSDCKSSKCKTCTHGFNLLSKQQHWSCKTNGKKYKIKSYSCNNRFVIYVIYCEKCGTYYIGSSIKELRTRAGQHRRKICSGCANIANLLQQQPQPPNPTDLAVTKCCIKDVLELF